MMKFDVEQEAAIKAMLSGKNVFLIGKAGTGKSVVIREFVCRSTRAVTLLAPTGTAAQNIGGNTIHRLFKFPAADYISEDMARQAAESNAAVLASIQIIVIDEISMVRCDLMTAMDVALKHVMPPQYRELPFGGKQLIVVGDFCQLPPVLCNLFVQEYVAAMNIGIFAFHSPAWAMAKFKYITLTKVHRQTDQLLLEIANCIRSGHVNAPMNQDVLATHGIFTPMSCIDVFNHKCYLQPTIEGNPIHLCSLRHCALALNQCYLSALPDKGIIFPGWISGDFPNDLLPTAQKLLVKRGSRMMLLGNKANSDGVYEYTNGTIGTVIDYSRDASAGVSLVLDNGHVVTVGKTLWCNYDYELVQDGHGNTSLQRHEVGFYHQLPLTACYAMTIHKCQGATLSGPVPLTLGTNPCFAPGQFYTAITRAKSLDQISIDRPATALDCKISEDVWLFHREHDIQ